MIPEEVQALFDSLEKIPKNAISMEDNMGGNVICSRCWTDWITNGEDWRNNRVEVVTIYNGKALCEKHFIAEKEIVVPGE